MPKKQCWHNRSWHEKPHKQELQEDTFFFPEKNEDRESFISQRFPLTKSLQKQTIVELAINSQRNIICVITDESQQAVFFSIGQTKHVVDYMKLLAAPKYEKNMEDEDDDDEQEESNVTAASSASSLNSSKKSEKNSKKNLSFTIEELKVFNLKRKLFTCVFTPDSKYCLIGCSDGKISVIQINTSLVPFQFSIFKEITYSKFGDCFALDVNSQGSLVAAAFANCGSPSSTSAASQQMLPQSKKQQIKTCPFVLYDIKSFFSQIDEYELIQNTPLTQIRFTFAPPPPSSPSSSIGRNLLATFSCVGEQNTFVVCDVDSSERFVIEHTKKEFTRSTTSNRYYDDDCHTDFSTSCAFSYNGDRFVTSVHCDGYSFMQSLIYVFDISGSPFDYEKEMQEEKNEEAKKIAATGAPLLFWLSLPNQESIISMNVIGRNTLVFLDVTGVVQSIALSSCYEEGNNVVAQEARFLSPSPEKEKERETEAAREARLKDKMLSLAGKKRSSGGTRKLGLLHETADQLVFVAASAEGGTSLDVPRNQIVVISNVRKVSNWKHKKPIFVVREFGHTKIAQLLQNEWVPLYLSSQFL